MSGILATITTGEISTTTVAKTLLNLRAPGNWRVRVWRWSIAFKGTSFSDPPVKLELVRHTNASTFSTNPPKVLIDAGADEVPQTITYANHSVEPAGTPAVLRSYDIHPRKGFFWACPFGDENNLTIKGNEYLGWRVLSAVNVLSVVTVLIEE